MDYLNKIFREPLEQFEIVKIGLWSWHNNSFMNFISQLWGKVEYFFVINSENPHPSWAFPIEHYYVKYDFYMYRMWFTQKAGLNKSLYIDDFAIKEASGNIDSLRPVPRPRMQALVEDVLLEYNFVSGDSAKDIPEFGYRKISTVNDLDQIHYGLNTVINTPNNLSELIYDSFDGFMDRVAHIQFNNFLFDLNSSFFFGVLITLIISFLFLPVTSNLRVISNGWQNALEKIYLFIVDMLKTQVGDQAKKFFPYLFTVFMFIILSNISGMTLFAFTLTSHIMVTFTLGVSTFIGLTILGFWIQKLKFLQLFVPSGIPAVLLPMLVVIEIVSYLSRALSLSIRLFANLMSGHTLLHILAFFSSKLMKLNIFIGIISLILILSIVVLELGIACLQAYVFTILICIYLNDSYHAGH